MIPKKIYILDTYGDYKIEDGLSSVYHKIKEAGEIRTDTKDLRDAFVLVAGICHVYLDKISSRNINVCYTTFEHFPLPRYWVRVLNSYYSIIIVPHKAIKEIFLNSGVKKPIFVVGQGFTKYKKLNCNKSNYNLGFLGVPVKRKNLDKIISALYNLHADYLLNDIILKIHISKSYEWIKDDSTNQLEHKLFIDYTKGIKDYNDISAWFSEISCYVFPSDGEGWSFTPRESLYLGIPTIISNIPVHEDLRAYCEVIDLPITPQKISESVVKVYQHYEHFKALALNGSVWLEKECNNDQIIMEITTIINEYQGRKKSALEWPFHTYNSFIEKVLHFLKKS